MPGAQPLAKCTISWQIADTFFVDLWLLSGVGDRALPGVAPGWAPGKLHIYNFYNNITVPFIH
jgi:hypothetical protein